MTVQELENKLKGLRKKYVDQVLQKQVKLEMCVLMPDGKKESVLTTLDVVGAAKVSPVSTDVVFVVLR